MSDLKLYGVSLQIESAAGYQIFGVMASSEEDAMERFKRGESTDDILFSEVEVLGLEKNFGIDDVECYEGLVDDDRDNGWISVNDRLPEKYSWYLIVSSTKVTMAFYDGDTVNEDVGLWLVHNDNPDSDEWENVTHWMPLPEPPTK